MPSPRDPVASSRTGSGTGILAFLVLLNVLNFVDRQLVTSLGYQIEQTLDISHARLGLLYGYVFIVFYTLMGVILGTLADRWNRPRLIAIGLFLWSLLTALSGAARNFVQMAGARMFVGIGEATLTPTALSMLSDVLPASARSRAAGIYYAGIPIGAGLSMIISAMLEPTIGWRGCFYLLGGLGIVFVIPLLLMRDPPREADSAGGATGGEAAAAAPIRPTTSQIFGDLAKAFRSCPALLLTILGGVLVVYAQSAGNMTVIWLQAERGMDLKQAGLTAGYIFMIFGLIGSVLGGVLSDWLQQRMSGGRLWLLVFGQFVFTPAGLALYLCNPESQAVPFYIGWALASMGSMMMYGPVFAAVQELAPARIRATAVAALIFLINVLGTGLGPFLTGLIGDKVSLTAGLTSSVLVGTLSLVPFYFAARRFDADREHAATL